MTGRRVLVTGGAGFIGSHTCKQLAACGYAPVVFDNLSTGHADNVRWGPIIHGDLADMDSLRAALCGGAFDCVVHFAASAYVGESGTDPQKYYRNNVTAMLNLLQCCREVGLLRLVFSSSCATYGIPDRLPILENIAQSPVNTYGRTKLIGEHMLADFAAAYGLKYVALRYFNAAGADPDGELVERHDPETHIIPRALMAAAGMIDRLDIFGDDYETPDGTCIRDFVHVSDLAAAHVRAVAHLIAGGDSLAANLATGRGTSIREITDAIARITGRPVPVAIVPRRPGDPPALYADTTCARDVLGFRPVHSDLDVIIRTAARSFGLL